LAYAAAPAQTVNVKLQDSGAAMTGMHVVVDHEKVKAGRVTLMADNQSKNLVHEVVVVAVKSAAQACRTTKKRSRLSRAASANWVRLPISSPARRQAHAQPSSRHLPIDLQPTGPLQGRPCPRR
jgi:hypothetical protein